MIGLAITGDKALAKALHKLPNAIYNRVIRGANNKLMRPVLKDAKRRAPVRFGLVKEALGIKTKTYPKKGVVFTAIGIRSGFHKAVGAEVKKKAGRGAGGKFESRGVRTFNYVLSPSKYAHLVELGHGGPYAASAHPFIRPAWDGQRMAMLPRYRLLLREGLDREVAKLKAKGGA
jgi:HK97 gp10 family phage protein